jgi:hypothetical protein
MTPAKTGISVLLVAALCLPGFWVLAGDDDDRPNSDKLTTAANAGADDVRSDDDPDAAAVRLAANAVFDAKRFNFQRMDDRLETFLSAEPYDHSGIS